MDEAATARAAAAAALGLRTDLDGAARAGLVQLVTADPDPGVRATALAAVVRAARVAAPPAWRAAAADDDATVRRRAAETAPALGDALTLDDLVALLHDTEAWVAEAAAFALGERGDRDAVPALAPAATEHDDPLVRESAVAALGAIGDPAGLPAVLRGCDDKPAIRRRAVLALAAFEGDEVEARLRAALEDRDWQVRQAAEDLIGHDASKSETE
jgi:HEAT repeat protein